MAPVAAGDKVQLLVGAARQWFEVVEVQTTTGAAGAFPFTTPQCSLTVQRLAGNPFASVSGDETFCGWVIRGVDDPSLWAVGFYHCDYGAMVSVPQALPVDETFTMAWQAGSVTIQEAGVAVDQGTAVDIILVRQVPGIGTVWQVYLHPNCENVGSETYTTDANGVVKWNHPSEGPILPRFPKGHQALGQRVMDLNPFTGDPPTEYTQEVRCYWKGEYVAVAEGTDVTLNLQSGKVEVTWPAGYAIRVAPENWDSAGWLNDWWHEGGAAWGTGGGPSTTTGLPNGCHVNIICYMGFGGGVNGDYQPYLQSVEVARGTTKQVSLAAPALVGGQIPQGYVCLDMDGTPGAGLQIYFASLDPWCPSGYKATVDAGGFWRWDWSLTYGVMPVGSYWIHDPTWGTKQIAVGIGTSFPCSLTVLGIHVATAFWYREWLTAPAPANQPPHVFTFPHVPYLPASVILKDENGVTYATQDVPWGGVRSVDHLPVWRYKTDFVEAKHQYTPYVDDVAGSAVQGTAELVSVACVPYGFAAVMGGKVIGNLLREKATEQIDPDLREAVRMGLEHGEWEPLMRQYFTG